MEVWIVSDWNWSTMGVFSTEEKAQVYIEKCDERLCAASEKWVVDDEAL